MKKMSLANIEGKLSRAEMRSIMAGSGSWDSGSCGYTSPSGYCVRGISKSNAIAAVAAYGGWWCCSSCSPC